MWLQEISVEIKKGRFPSSPASQMWRILMLFRLKPKQREDVGKPNEWLLILYIFFWSLVAPRFVGGGVRNV